MRLRGALAAGLLLALAGCEGAEFELPTLPSAEAEPESAPDGASGGAPDTSPPAGAAPLPQPGADANARPDSGPGAAAEEDDLATADPDTSGESTDLASALPLPEGAEIDAPAPPPEDVPDIYMALQQASDGAVSVIFAIDEAKDNTPSDDRAIRISPEDGRCNPQELNNYLFPVAYGTRPVFSSLQASEGVTSDKLPAFMAIAVSTEMINLGIAETPEDTHPQNVCTRKLWQRLVLADAAAQGGDQSAQAGQ